MNADQNGCAMEVQWLDRETNRLPYFTLCGTEQLYRDAMAHLQIAYPQAWIPSPKKNGAVTHFYENPQGDTVCVVALDIKEYLGRDQVMTLSMLVHEASHIVDTFFDSIGETKPAEEQRAYAMQYVASELFYEYRRQKEALTGRA